MDLESLEKTGPNYSVEKMLMARRKTTEAVLRIAENIHPGMLEEDARRVGQETLMQLGSSEGWHKTLVRFGTNTVKRIEDRSRFYEILIAVASAVDYLSLVDHECLYAAQLETRYP